MEYDPLTLFLCFPALNQFYYVNNKNLEYKIFIENIQNQPLLNSITYLDKKQLDLVINSNLTLIFYNENDEYLNLDKTIIEKSKTLNLKRKYLTEDGLLAEINKNKSKNYLVMNDKIETLLKFHAKGCWTVLLTPMIFSHWDKEYSIHHDTISKISKNIEYIKNGGDKFFNFTTNNFYQLLFYYKEIQKINIFDAESSKANYNLFNNLLNKFNPLKVCLFVRTLRRSQEFKKQRFYISNEQVLYYSHIGGDDISINHKFKVILAKTVELKDLYYYSTLLTNIVKYCEENAIMMLNYIPSFKQFVEKDSMGDYLKKFVSSEIVQSLVTKYSLNILYPTSININILEVMEKSKLIQLLKKNNFNFPIIIKYKGESNCLNHLVSLLFTENSIDCYLDYLNNLEFSKNENKNKTTLVIQKFVNHGGRVLKLYHINKENYIDYRPSLPDMNVILEGTNTKKFEDNFPMGLWTFKTIDLESEKYKDLLSIYSSDNKIQNLINEEKSIRLKFMKEVVDEFEKYSQFSLFGIDFLYAYDERTFYLIDCNSLPGYKIKNLDLAEKFRQHLLNYFFVEN